MTPADIPVLAVGVLREFHQWVDVPVRHRHDALGTAALLQGAGDIAERPFLDHLEQPAVSGFPEYLLRLGQHAACTTGHDAVRPHEDLIGEAPRRAPHIVRGLQAENAVVNVPG